MEVKKFKGCPYPITPHPLGYLRTQWGVNQIKSDMLTLLLTNPGERVMLPNFGTPLKKLFFEPNDVVLRAQARQMIVDAIQTWEPRVAITNIEVTSGTGVYSEDQFMQQTATPVGALNGANEDNAGDQELADEHVLAIRINFIDPENIAEVQELILEVPLI